MSTSVSGLSSNFFPSPQNGFTTTLASTVSPGATTVPLNSVAGFSNGDIAVLVVDPANASKQTFTGIVDTSGVQLTSVVWTAGTNVTHLQGATVTDYATATHIAMMSKGIKVAHNQDGTHKSGAVYALPTITDFTNATHDHSSASKGGNIPYAGLLSTIFSSQVTTYANPGSAGGTFYYINLGGIKLFWGATANQTIGGAAPASAAVAITFPSSFFTTVQSATATPGPETGTQYAFLGTNTISATTWSINFQIISGSAGVFNANVFVIGT